MTKENTTEFQTLSMARQQEKTRTRQPRRHFFQDGRRAQMRTLKDRSDNDTGEIIRWK